METTVALRTTMVARRTRRTRRRTTRRKTTTTTTTRRCQLRRLRARLLPTPPPPPRLILPPPTSHGPPRPLAPLTPSPGPPFILRCFSPTLARLHRPARHPPPRDHPRGRRGATSAPSLDAPRCSAGTSTSSGTPGRTPGNGLLSAASVANPSAALTISASTWPSTSRPPGGGRRSWRSPGRSSRTARPRSVNTGLPTSSSGSTSLPRPSPRVPWEGITPARPAVSCSLETLWSGWRRRQLRSRACHPLTDHRSRSPAVLRLPTSRQRIYPVFRCVRSPW